LLKKNANRLALAASSRTARPTATEASIHNALKDALPGLLKNVYAHSAEGGKFLAVLLLTTTAALSAEAQTALPPVEPKGSCASLRGFDPRIPGAPAQITDAREVLVDPTQGSQQAGQPVGFQGGPTGSSPGSTGAATRGTRMCVVQGYVSPQIRFEVRLPLQGWTQRYLQTGCGGLCGNLRVEAPQRPCQMLQRGEFVMASTALARLLAAPAPGLGLESIQIHDRDARRVDADARPLRRDRPRSVAVRQARRQAADVARVV
jgi:Tannase and feruloyl esterase